MCSPANKAVAAIGEERSSPGSGGPAAARRRRGRAWRRPHRAPETWREEVAMAAATVGYAWSETIGKWPLADLLVGVRYLSLRQGNREIRTVYAGRNCVQLIGSEIAAEMVHLLRLLTLCLVFTGKQFPEFLKSLGYSKEDVLLQKSKAAFMKPSFTILCDRNTKCILLLIRGARSAKDRLTAATAAVVPFHHLIVHEGSLSDLVVGYAHCGMVAAARWIAKCTTPCLLRAISQYPDYNIKIIGHSLGGGIAALLTYILREHEEFSSSSCIAFGPAACMTWDLADSSKFFVTTIVNNADVVPTLSTVSVDNLRSEVAASAWSKDCLGRVSFTRFLSDICGSVSILWSCLPFISGARVVDDGPVADLHPACSGNQDVVNHKQHLAESCIRNPSSLCCCSCVGSQRVYDTTANKAASGHGATAETEVDELHLGYSVASDHKGTSEWEEKHAMHKVSSDTQSSVSDASELHQLYPPGRIIHMIGEQDPSVNLGEHVVSDEHVSVYETPRHLYGKVHLSQTMINDHYMDMYVKTMKQVINKLSINDIASTNDVV